MQSFRQNNAVRPIRSCMKTCRSCKKRLPKKIASSILENDNAPVISAGRKEGKSARRTGFILVMKSIRSTMQRAAALLAAVVVAFSPARAAAEDYWPSNIGVSEEGESAIVMEEETGTVLYEKNADVQHYPASITKIMTTMLAIENSSPDDTVTYSENAVFGIDRGSSSIARDVGEQLTMEQCWYAMMLESCNSTCIAVAEHVAGSVDAFVQMMNDRAAQLGCTNTHFANPNGLPNDNHYTTARDMAYIAREAFKNETFRKVTGTKSTSIPPTNKHDVPTPLNNHHAMLNYYKTSKYLYDYCVGGKTGYTTIAKNTLVTYAKKDGMTLVCVIMNANGKNHYIDTTNLFNYCFDNFTLVNIADQTKLFEKSSTWDAGSLGGDRSPVSIDDTAVVVLPKTANFSDAQVNLVPATAQAQMQVEGDGAPKAGTLMYTYAGRAVGSADVNYVETESKATYPFSDTDTAMATVSDSYININLLYLIPVALAVFGIVLIVRSVKRSTNVKRRFKTHYKPKKQTGAAAYTQIRRRAPKRGKHRSGHDLTSSDRHSDSFLGK